MKTSIISLVVVGALTGCQPHTELKSGSDTDLSDFAKKYFKLNSAAGIIHNSAQNSMMRKSAQAMSMFHSSARVTFSAGRIASSPAGGSNCGIDTLIHNADGSSTQVIDYGDSCVNIYDYAKVVYWGKSTSSYQYTNKIEGSAYVSEYFGNSRFKNFGGKYISKDYNNTWNSNGYYSYSGVSRYDTISQIYSGSSESLDSSAFSYNKQTYLYLGSARNTYDNKTSIEQYNDYRYVYGDNFYHSQVTVPVVRDYTCNPYPSQDVTPSSAIVTISVPISGHEIIDYKQGDKTGSFEVDYGNGECDTLVTITEDGKSIVIDLTRLNFPGMTGG